MHKASAFPNRGFDISQSFLNIESQANKYTFVWKKIANRNCEHLMKKIHVLLRQIDYVMRNGQTKPGYNLQS